MSKIIDSITADLGGINPEQMAEHLRAIASLTPEQLHGMLGWAQQAQDRDAYRIAFELIFQARPADSEVLTSLMGRRAYFGSLFPAEPDPAMPPAGPDGFDLPSEEVRGLQFEQWPPFGDGTYESPFRFDPPPAP